MPTETTGVNRAMLQWVRDMRAAGLTREQAAQALSSSMCNCVDCREGNPARVRQNRISVMRRCPSCDAPTINPSSGPAGRDLRAIGAGDYLSCEGCAQCDSCCGCETCERCGDRASDLCNDCADCRNCCRCVRCDSCEGRASDRCSRCYRCDSCGCSCAGQMPRFGRSRAPTFHEPGLREARANRSRRFVSAEIEVARVNRDNGVSTAVKDWGGAIVDDGSLGSYGFEINTAPAGGDLYIKQVTEICDALRESGGTVDGRCGTHVHVDARDLKYLEMRRLLQLYASFEDVFFGMVPESRRDSQYCQPCGDDYMGALKSPVYTAAEPRHRYKALRKSLVTDLYGDEESYVDPYAATPQRRRRRPGERPVLTLTDRALRSRAERKRDKYHDARYRALNVHSWYYRGTVECRILNGTVDAETIVCWGMLWARMVDAAVALTDAEVNTVDNATKRARSSGRSKGQAYDEFMRVIVRDSKRLQAFVNKRLTDHSTGVLHLRAQASAAESNAA